MSSRIASRTRKLGVKAAASIVTVEARHASVFGLILQGTSQSISPNGPFDKPFRSHRVLHDVKELGFIQASSRT